MKSRPPEYFEAIYANNPDPWNFGSSPYEHQKYQATLAALGGQHFASALEIGCSIGILTRLLAPLCTRLLALDIVDAALATARKNCADHPHITFENRLVPENFPPGRYDLILLSEVIYFLTPIDLNALAQCCINNLAKGGRILLVNYTGPIHEPAGTGNTAADLFCSAAALPVLRHSAEATYRLDLLGDISPELEGQ